MRRCGLRACRLLHPRKTLWSVSRLPGMRHRFLAGEVPDSGTPINTAHGSGDGIAPATECRPGGSVDPSGDGSSFTTDTDPPVRPPSGLSGQYERSVVRL